MCSANFCNNYDMTIYKFLLEGNPITRFAMKTCQNEREIYMYIYTYIFWANVIRKPKVNNSKDVACHYDDVIMGTIASQITSLTIVYSALYSGADQSKHQSSASLAFVWRIHRGPVNSPHKWPVTRKMSPFDDVIMLLNCSRLVFYDYYIAKITKVRLLGSGKRCWDRFSQVKSIPEQILGVIFGIRTPCSMPSSCLSSLSRDTTCGRVYPGS